MLHVPHVVCNPPLEISLPQTYLLYQLHSDGEGVVFVRLVKVGTSTRPVQVQLSTVDGSAMGETFVLKITAEVTGDGCILYQIH